MAAIQDMVLTFCPTMHSVQQRKLELLMHVLRNWKGCEPLQKPRQRSQIYSWGALMAQSAERETTESSPSVPSTSPGNPSAAIYTINK